MLPVALDEEQASAYTRDRQTRRLRALTYSPVRWLETAPPPTSYNLPSDFVSEGKRGHQFGCGRDAYAKVFVKESPAFSVAVPGPGTYDVLGYRKGKSPKFTMRLRTADPTANTTDKAAPGPGEYTLVPAINARGTFLYSKFRNSAATLFNPTSSMRFKDSRAVTL